MTKQPNKRVFFFHIPKTAGTSVSRYFLRRVERQRFFIGAPQADVQAQIEIDPEAALYYAAHMSWDEYEKLNFRHRSFTFLRDPRSRLISSYYFVRYSKASEENMSELSKATRKYDLGGWLQYCVDGTSADSGQNNGSDNTYLRILLGRDAVNDKRRLEYDMDGSEMALACQRLRQFECVGIVEDFDNSLLMISAAMQLTPPEANDLVPQNQTDSKATIKRDKITDKMEDSISELCKYDRVLYDYGQELFAQQKIAYGTS